MSFIGIYLLTVLLWYASYNVCIASFHDFMDFWYAQWVHREQEDRLCWILDRNGMFTVKSYYKVLTRCSFSAFPWMPIWKDKVPPRVAFFVWMMAAKGKILTKMDNLRKQKICIVEWCCLCKSSGESSDFMIFSFLLVWPILGYAG